jgi:hypothetical protein
MLVLCQGQGPAATSSPRRRTGSHRCIRGFDRRDGVRLGLRESGDAAEQWPLLGRNIAVGGPDSFRRLLTASGASRTRSRPGAPRIRQATDAIFIPANPTPLMEPLCDDRWQSLPGSSRRIHAKQNRAGVTVFLAGVQALAADAPLSEGPAPVQGAPPRTSTCQTRMEPSMAWRQVPLRPLASTRQTSRRPVCTGNECHAASVCSRASLSK